MINSAELSLGQLLSRKRKELNVEISHIASYLKIKARDIEAVEEEKWDKITKHIYKTGLIRSYAKMLKIDIATIEDRIRNLPFESNTKNQKHRLLNIGEELEITPNRDMFFNFLLISILLFLTLLAIYNASEKKSKLLTSQDLISDMNRLP
ncbi:MAG: hypothetical protein EXR06_02220 [Rickettsiales bacterium]|nr:hypothetical protein [Rickettsiales bacterium]